MKNSQIADINSVALIIAACFAHGLAAAFLAVLALFEIVRYASLSKRGQ